MLERYKRGVFRVREQKSSPPFLKLTHYRSTDAERANRVARKLASGRVLINTIGHDPFAPFGGFKQSGIGREGGIFGLQEYLEPKAIIS